MKKILTLILITTIFISCKKSETGPDSCLTEPSYTGKWELRTQTCGWSGQTTYNAGNNNLLSLNDDNKFMSTGIIADTGTYEIVSWINSKGERKPILKMTGKATHQFEVTLLGDSLSIDNNSTIADGCGYRYKRLR